MFNILIFETGHFLNKMSRDKTASISPRGQHYAADEAYVSDRKDLLFLDDSAR